MARRSVNRASAFARKWKMFLSRHLSLARLDEWAKNIRSSMLNLAFLAFLAVLVPLLIAQFRRDQVIIEPIAVPEALVRRGLTETVVANRLWDGLQDVKLAARTSKETIDSLPDSRSVDFSIPDSGFSIESFVFHTRKLFNSYETRIAGEIVCADVDCSPSALTLRLRVIRDSVVVLDLPPVGDTAERVYFSDAAAAVLAILDPFVALAATSETQPIKATTLARRLIRAHHKDAKWAHNLIGIIRENEGDIASALAEYRAALALDPVFVPARVNLGNVLLTSGDTEGARQAYQIVRDFEPQNVAAAEGFAKLALAAGDNAAAVQHYLNAAEWDPVDPRYLTSAGRIEMASGRSTEGEDLLRRALELDPGYLPAFAELAAMHLGNGDYAAAERFYRDAADYAPDNPEAQAAHGQILAILKEWDGAANRYQRAAILAPESIAYQREHAIILHRMGQVKQALAELESLIIRAPEDASVYLAMADSLRDLGRNANAVEAYRKFLDLGAPQDPMRPIAEQFINLLSK